MSRSNLIQELMYSDCEEIPTKERNGGINTEELAVNAQGK